ncbi:MAG: polysaccharide deacetylase family protein [Thiolinea sp.]
MLIDLIQQGCRNVVLCALPVLYTAGYSPASPAPDFTGLSKPPGNLDAGQMPQFVMIGSDDNTKSAGIHWLLNLLENRRNPAGTDNPATYDGSPARISFYLNTAGFDQWLMDDPKLLVEATRKIAAQGHELGNHTKTHHADINKLPWDEFQSRVKNFSGSDWQERITSMETDLKQHIGQVKLNGFRAPYLAYNQPMMDTLVKLGYRYDSSVEEGSGKQFDGTNFRWPYRMDNGIPGHAESWRGSPHNKDAIKMSSAAGLWQLPNYVLIVPDDTYAQQYDFEAGLWSRMKEQSPTLNDHKITGYDYNLWVHAKLSGRAVLAILKYNLDLRLTGNRAPFMLGIHSQYYVDKAWAKQHTDTTISEMQATIEAFIDYALSRPEVRIRPANDVLDWLENPVALSR